MRYYEILAEALKFSQIKPYMKDWNRERYSDIFINPKYKHDKKGYRVFLPIEPENKTIEKSQTHKEIEKFLNQNGFEIIDYIKGIARNKTKNQEIKIGKILNKLNPTETVSVTNTKGITKNLPLIDAFNVDKTREAKKSEYIAVISRHPYDIAGMSTNRGWTSCMNLDTGINRHYVPIDIKEGTIIAYVTKISDPDLKNPTARVLIKPFVDILGSPNIQFGIEDRIYGTDVPNFINTVKKWVDSVNNSKILNDVAIFKFNNKLYNDSGLATQTIIKGKKLNKDEEKDLQNLSEYPRDIFIIKNPTEIQRIIAITSTRAFSIFKVMLKYDDYIPSFKEQLAAITKDYTDIIPLMKKMYPDQKIDNRIYDTVLNALSNDNGPYAKSYLDDLADLLLTYNIKLPAQQISKILNISPQFLGEFINQGYNFNKEYIINLIKNSKYPGSIYEGLIENNIDVDNDIDLTVINSDLSIIKTTTMNKIIQINLAKYNKVPEKIKDAILNRKPEMILTFIKNREKYSINISNDEIVNCIISEKLPADQFLYIINKLFDEFEFKFDEKQIEKIINNTEDTQLIFFTRILDSYGYLTDDMARNVLKKTYTGLEFIKEPTERDYKHALRKSYKALDFIEYPTYEQLQYAISKTYPDEFNYDGFKTYDSALERSQLSDDDKTQLLYYLVKQVPDSIVGIIKNHKKYNLTKTIQKAAINSGSGTKMIQAMYDHNIIPDDNILIKFLEEPQVFDRLGNSGFLMRFVNNYKNKKTNYTLSDKVLDKLFEKNTDNIINLIIRDSYNIPIGNDRLKKYLSNNDNQLDFKKFANFMRNYQNYNIEITPEILKLLLEYDRGSEIYNEHNLILKIYTLIDSYSDILNDELYKVILDKNPTSFKLIKNPSKELINYMNNMDNKIKLDYDIQSWEEQ